MNTQQRILNFIIRFQHEKGFAPTFREIGEGVGLKSSSTVSGHLDRLDKKGLVRRLHGSGRTIEVIDQEEQPRLMEMSRKVEVKVTEVLPDGTYKTIIIGGQQYVLQPTG